MNRRPLIAGNWKMHTLTQGAQDLAATVAKVAAKASDRDVMIAPPYTALAAVKKTIAGSAVILGAQNVHWEEQGAFTGEISAPMLKDLGCAMAIVGHSERRHVFGETDRMINKRISGALQFGLIPVFCIGETLEQREANQTMTVLADQIRGGLDSIALTGGEKIIVAYEPVWAIGTGKTATEVQAQEAHHFIRELLAGIYEKNIAAQIRILYGGSVKPDNIDILMQQEDIDGALVGGAALKAESFERIICFQ
jgi:triosephosphate isomerase (TIM)